MEYTPYKLPEIGETDFLPKFNTAELFKKDIMVMALY
jgi:hypothetical protein